jgi:hypothetical protein
MRNKTIVITMILSLIMLCGVFAEELFTFDNTFNNSVGNITGSINLGSPSFLTGANCIKNDCLYLDGDSAITLSALPISNLPAQEFTASCWVYPESSEVIAQYFRIGSNSLDSGFSLGRNTLDQFAFNYRGNGWAHTSITYNLSTWYYVTWIYENIGGSKNTDFFLNGINETETDESVDLSGNAPDISDFGQYAPALQPSYMWKGRLDECKFIERKMTESEILAEYNSFFTPPCLEDWQQFNTTCNGVNQTLYYLDNNLCGTYGSLPGNNGTISACSLPPITPPQSQTITKIILSLFVLILSGIGAFYMIRNAIEKHTKISILIIEICFITLGLVIINVFINAIIGII